MSFPMVPQVKWGEEGPWFGALGYLNMTNKNIENKQTTFLHR
jgi:hypothetical protein